MIPAELDSPAARLAFEAARALHLTPPRHYHDFTHVEACLRGWVRFRGLWVRPREAFWAFVFHDAVYVSGAGDNEAQSAAAARTHLAADVARVEALDLDAIAGLIDKTALHADPRMPGLADTWTPDERLFVDLDAGILGAAPADYDRYAAQIRAEYAFVPAELYAAGRARFLRAMLDRARIFLTDTLAPLEARARENLSRELEALGRAP